MAKLTRKTQKIFANAGSAVGQFGSAQTGTPVLVPTNDPDVIQALDAYEQGWNDATISGDKRPPLEEFNGVLNKLDRQISYILQEGLAEYDAGTEYYTNSIVKESGTIDQYKSLTDNNIGNPLSDPINWELIPTASGLGTAAFKDVGTTDGTLPEIGVGDKLDTALIDTGAIDGQIPIVGAGDKIPNSIINDATESLAGIREIATQTEANSDTNDITFLTPQKLHNSILGLDFIAEQDAPNASTSVEFINLPLSDYRTFYMVLTAVKVANNGVDFFVRLSNDNGSNWNQGAADYRFAVTGRSTSGGGTNNQSAAASQMEFSDNGGGNQLGNGGDQSFNGTFTFFGLDSNVNTKLVSCLAVYGADVAGRSVVAPGMGDFYGNALPVNGIQFLLDSGTFNSGNFKLYGVK